MRPLSTIFLLAACAGSPTDPTDNDGTTENDPAETDVASGADTDFDTDAAVVDTEPNEAPTITMVGPLDGMIVKADSLTRLTAEVSDPDDALTTLEIAWSSDAEGPLGTSMTDAAGGTSIAGLLSAGPHRIQVTVTDPDGATATDSVDLYANVIPPKPHVRIVPELPTSTDDLVAEVGPVVDPDSDAPVQLEFSWFVDGVEAGIQTPRVTADQTTAGEMWAVQVVARDATHASALAVDITTIADVAP